MSENQETPWRGRLRLSTPARDVPHRDAPLTENELEAIEAWMPAGAKVIAHARGRFAHDSRSVWLLTVEGVLLATLTEEGADRLRARVHWLPAAQLRRIDAICHGEHALVRVVSLSRGFVLTGVSEDSATRFVALVRATVQDSARPRTRPLLRRVSS